MNTTSSYEALFSCYLSEQMSQEQFEAHIRDDEVFRLWVCKRNAARKKALSNAGRY